ncbi:hypothetical protein [uncultured Corynebacterium sp.]|uniref:hypothetical protein n=1 Tax=uncultured Corynebacterium sp. TaxID=159447 RepID=UPI0025F090D4|nr:hypothetical protein [uncultured Corynebacterium sp.]
MSDRVELIDGDGTVIGWCRSMSPPGDRGDRVVVQCDEWVPNATVEVDHRIVPADSNGGIYQTRRWTRHVTEWKPDE